MVIWLSLEVNGTVLFSQSSCLWKLADFGFTAEGSSKNVIVSKLGRGTEGYRAPELIEEEPIYTRKVDIFAFGCILYEIVFGRKAFRNDWNVWEYARSKKPLTFPRTSMYSTDSPRFIRETLDTTLQHDWVQRPTAKALLIGFKALSLHLVKPISSEDFWPTTPLSKSRLAVQFPRHILVTSIPGEGMSQGIGEHFPKTSFVRRYLRQTRQAEGEKGISPIPIYPSVATQCSLCRDQKLTVSGI